MRSIDLSFIVGSHERLILSMLGKFRYFLSSVFISLEPLAHGKLL